jgi:post-segregation antitoxin (ccd killing protein)
VAVMVIEVPEELKPLGDAMMDAIAAVRKARAATGAGKAVDYAAVEVAIGGAAARIERAGHLTVLQSLDVDRPSVMIGGARFTKVGRCEATYYTLAGPVVVERSLYREAGKRNAKVVDPVSLRAGVVADGWLPRTASAMAHQVQQVTSREAEESARRLGRLPYSRSSFERVAHAVGDLYVPAHGDIEDALIEEYEIPREARSVSVSLDRVSVPMEEPRPRPVGRPKKDDPKRPVARNFRMAYCATVTLHDRDGNGLHTIRYGRMPQGDARNLCEGLGADVAALLAKRPGLKVATLCDGAAELWNLLSEPLGEEALGTEVHKVVDLWHLLEKLGRAAGVIHGSSAADEVVQRWRLRLLNSSRAAEAILGELKQSRREHVQVGDARPVHDAITYIENNGDRMDYATARRRGLPVGSGNVEATCKSLVEVRMKRPGARWKEESGEHVIQLRAVALSDRWDAAMDRTLKPLRKAVRAA